MNTETQHTESGSSPPAEARPRPVHSLYFPDMKSRPAQPLGSKFKVKTDPKTKEELRWLRAKLRANAKRSKKSNPKPRHEREETTK